MDLCASVTSQHAEDDNPARLMLPERLRECQERLELLL